MTSRGFDDKETRQTALGILRSGGVVVLPTDTLPGFASALSSRSGIIRIDNAKRISVSRPYVLLVSDVSMVARHVESFGCSTIEHMRRIWPAPLSVILPAISGVSPWQTQTLAFRVPALASLRELISALDEPIVSTSVNLSGHDALQSEADISAQFGELVDLIVSGESKGNASTLVDLSGAVAVVLRDGDYAWAEAGDSNPSN